MKKTRKAGVAAPKTPAPTSGDGLIEAQHHVTAGRWREAILAYKNLLKGADTPDTRLGLATAYAGRARELAAKGMSKEALTIWDNRAQIAPELPPEPDYLALLLRLGRVAQALDQCVRWADRLEPATRAALRSHLAAHHLAGAPEVTAGLPADDPILVQGDSAAQAIDAYCRGDDAALGSLLATIPFRSPYRDLAQCLKALQRLPTAPAEAAGMLARIGDDSGFAPLARACTLAAGPVETLTQRLASAGEQPRRFALTLAGWGEERLALWAETHQAADAGPRGLLRLLHRRRTLLGEDWARCQALRLLVPGFPKSASLITEGGGRRLSEKERLLVAAWQSEEQRAPFAVLEAWDLYIGQLEKDGQPVPGTDAALRIALCLRRADTLFNVLDRASASDDMDELDFAVCERVATSLEYDPDDRDCYEKLIRFYLRGDDLKTVRPLLDQGLKRFPTDVGLLTAALDTALAGDAFKKAARYAREILVLDPINRGARERLVKAHLAHARKQIRAKRPDLARKELDQAAEWDQAGGLKERRALLAGLLEMTVNKAQGQTALREQVTALGGGLTAAFALLVEALACGHSPASTLKIAGLGKTAVRDQADLNAFLARLRTHLEEGETLPAELKRLFENPLVAGAGYSLTLPESEMACDTLRRAGLNQARHAFAEAALKRCPDTPIFVLHHFESRFEDLRHYPDSADLDRLLAAGERAREAGDERTSLRIEEALRHYAMPSFLSGPFGGFWDEEDDDEDEDDLFGGPPDAQSEAALRALVEIMGIDQMLKMAGFNAKERAVFNKMERELGRAGMVDYLIEVMQQNLPDFGRELLPGPGPGFPGGRGPKPRPSGSPGPGPGRKTGKHKPPGPDDPDDGSQQFDLF